MTDLKKLAEAATQGEWSLSVLEPFYLIQGDEAAYPLAAFAEWDEQGYVRHVFRNAEANSAYIAAAHPQKILELLQEVETLRELTTKVTQALLDAGYEAKVADFDISVLRGMITRTRQETLEEARKEIRKLTYSFESRSKMESYFVRAFQHTGEDTKP